MKTSNLKSLVIYLPNGATQIVNPREGFAGDYQMLAEVIGRPFYPQNVAIKYEIK